MEFGLGKRERLQGEEADGDKPHLGEGRRACDPLEEQQAGQDGWRVGTKTGEGGERLDRQPGLAGHLKGLGFSSNRTTVGLKKEVVL